MSEDNMKARKLKYNELNEQIYSYSERIRIQQDRLLSLNVMTAQVTDIYERFNIKRRRKEVDKK